VYLKNGLVTIPMGYLLKHVTILEKQMRSITHLPTAFEYYSAKHMTLLYKEPFHVYRDISPVHKINNNFPVQDKGVDLADDYLTHIAQVKYYGHGKIIHYGTLSTFLGSPLLVGNKNLKLTLIRPTHTILHKEIADMVERGDIMELMLCSKDFLKEMQL